MCYLGENKIDTKTHTVRSGKANFNEKFAMKTVLNYDEKNDIYEPKPVLYSLTNSFVVSFANL
jgi:hypothetical protein